MTNFTPLGVLPPGRAGRNVARMTADHRLPDAATRAPTILIADDHDLVRDGVKLMVTAMWPGARVLEAAATARTAASENSESLRHNAGEALASARDNAGEVLSKARETASHALSSAKESASDTAAAARDAAASADLGGKASKLADELVALVSTRVEALGDAIKARLPKS